jgi:demethylspheroidene O-methyltransferase
MSMTKPDSAARAIALDAPGPSSGLASSRLASSRLASTWLDRLYGLRDRLLTSPSFRRWAASFPLTRPIAHRRTLALFNLCGGFVYSQILAACVELNLFEMLAEGPQSGAALSRALSLSPEATARLLAAAVSLDLVSRRGRDRYGLGALGAAVVDNPAVTAMVRHHAMLYADLKDPVGLLRGQPQETELARYWAYARAARPAHLSTDEIADYTKLMAVSQAMIAEEILDAYRVDRHRRLLDIGGGDGTFLAAAGARAPNLALMLFDLPSVADTAKSRLASLDVGDRLTAIGGDFLSDTLPDSADVISLVRVLLDHDDDAALTLLRAVRKALPPDGTLLLAEPMSETPGAEPIGDAYFGFYLLAMRSGRPRTPGHIRNLLREAGFTRSRLARTGTPLLVRLIVARP